MTKLKEAIAFAQTHESTWDRDASGNFGVHLNDPPPWNRLYGPIHSRGPASGVVLHEGQKLAAWGEPDRADLTFSVAKMYLALLAGVARSEEHTSDLQSLMRISYAVFCLKKKNILNHTTPTMTRKQNITQRTNH